MQVITPRHIEAYTQCPRRLKNSWSSLNKSTYTPAEKIVGSVIQNIFLWHTRRGQTPLWKQIMNWTERYMLEHGQVEPENIQTYKDTKGYLSRIGAWYDNYGEDLCYPGLPNLPIALELSPTLIYQDKIPLLLVTQEPVLADFKEIRDSSTARSYNSLKLYNNLQILTRCWGFWKSSGMLPKKYIDFVISPGTIRPTHLYLTKKRLMYVEQIVEQVARGIHMSVFYQSKTEQCDSCPYNNNCQL